VDFIARVSADPRIPGDLFDSVVENLLENARQKRQLKPDVDISVTLECSESLLRIAVSDSGEHVPWNVAGALFKRPVESQSGLGIGLYHAARQAELLGYRLALDHNEDGMVSFSLARTSGD
jgi:sensor histidine kinase regulating citrate/malate metabolism